MAPSNPPLPDFSQGDGLLPAIAQDSETGEVLMIAYMNEEAWRRTLATREAHYYSRSRGRLWRKGEESGNVQQVVEAYVDCDADAILLKVRQQGGAACHTGFRSCFYREVGSGEPRVVGARVFDPATVYRNDSHSPEPHAE